MDAMQPDMTRSAPTLLYRLFGLVIESELELSQFKSSRIANKVKADVRFALGSVDLAKNAQPLDDIWISSDADSIAFELEDVGCFRIEGGNSITIDIAEQATADEIAVYLLGSAMGVLLHQRNLLPMHANAVVLGGKAVLFCGDSGAGKSTLAAYMRERGHAVLSDDISALAFGDAEAIHTFPGLPRIKLWQDALDEINPTDTSLTPVPWYDTKFELSTKAIVDQPLYPVAAICHLTQTNRGEEPGLHRVSGLDAINIVTANIYRRRLADFGGHTRSYIDMTAKLIKAVPIFRMARDLGFENFYSEVESAEATLIRLIEDSEVAAGVSCD